MRTKTCGDADDVMASEATNEADGSILLSAWESLESRLHSRSTDDTQGCRLIAAGFGPNLSLLLNDGIQPLASVSSVAEMPPATDLDDVGRKQGSSLVGEFQ
jgi:hypothetical protein